MLKTLLKNADMIGVIVFNTSAIFAYVGGEYMHAIMFMILSAQWLLFHLTLRKD